MAFKFSRSSPPRQLFINNEYVDSKSSRKLTLYNPKDGSLVANDVACAGENDVNAAVKAGAAAFPGWSSTPEPKRRDILLKFADLMITHKDSLAELTRITLGAPVMTGRGEVDRCAESFKYYAGWVDKLGGESYPGMDGFMKIVRVEPLGVVAGITSFNGPIGTVGLKAAPALAAGNSFILKPSEKTPFASLALGVLIKAAGFPPGVFQVLSGDGETGALLSAHMAIRKISFTGSLPTGKKIQELAAKSNLKRVTLELGGKSPAVVFDDANLDNAVTWTANAITRNTGQVCFAASRVYVQEGIYGRFVAKYKEAMLARQDTVGDPDLESTGMGPVVDKAQRDRINGFVERAETQKHGTLLVGGQTKLEGKPEGGYFVGPTAFTDVDVESEIHTTEVFGPVAVIRKFATEEEALRISNDTEFGLMAGVFTNDITKALRVAAKFEAGMVGVNCVSAMFVGQPFGGYKQSGQGREGGREGILAWMNHKTVFINCNV